MPKRSLKSQDDDVRLWNGKPVRSLHPFDLKLELKYYKLLAKGEKVKVSEQRNRLSNHLRSLLTFQTLPDEIVLKIIKMTVSHSSDRDKVIQISKLSSRFNRIARDTSLWRGAVGLSLNRVDDKTLKDLNFLGEGVTNLTLSERYWNKYIHLDNEDLNTIAENCPNLVSLTLRHIAVKSWPSLDFGVKNLRICCNPYYIDMFEGAKLDLIFPQMELFRFDAVKNNTAPARLKDAIWLPNMTACQNLQKVYIRTVVNAGLPKHAFKFKIPSELEETGPFPQGLKILEIHGSILNFTGEEIRANKGPDCKVLLHGPDWYSKCL